MDATTVTDFCVTVGLAAAATRVTSVMVAGDAEGEAAAGEEEAEEAEEVVSMAAVTGGMPGPEMETMAAAGELWTTAVTFTTPFAVTGTTDTGVTTTAEEMGCVCC